MILSRKLASEGRPRSRDARWDIRVPDMKGPAGLLKGQEEAQEEKL
jgi:hypothetical protein